MKRVTLSSCLFFLLSFQLWAVTEQQCRSQLARASGLAASNFEYQCETQDGREKSGEVAQCLGLFKNQHLGQDEYIDYCTRNNNAENVQATLTCLTSAHAAAGLSTRHHILPDQTLRLCADQNIRGQFNQIVSCVATTSPLFANPGESQGLEWSLTDLCRQGGIEVVNKVKACIVAKKSKIQQIIPETNHESIRELVQRQDSQIFYNCSRPEVYNNLTTILRCQDRVGQSVRRLIDQDAASYAERNRAPDRYHYEMASEKGIEALDNCDSNATLNSRPEEVMNCVDALANGTGNNIFATYEVNTNNLFAVSLRGNYFSLHVERCATDELRQFQVAVLACMNRVGQRVPRTDVTIAGGSYIYCEMFTSARSGLENHAPAAVIAGCPEAK